MVSPPSIIFVHANNEKKVCPFSRTDLILHRQKKAQSHVKKVRETLQKKRLILFDDQNSVSSLRLSPALADTIDSIFVL